MASTKVTRQDLLKMKQEGKKITALTGYDYSFARMIDQAGIDLILVGDSLGMVMLGYENTLAVTMDEMVHHVKAVKRGVKRAMVVGDMPFMSYQISTEEAIKNAGRMVQEGGAEAVKIEGGLHMANTVKALVNIGIPVMGHIGLTPQSYHQLGGFRVQGRSEETQHLLKESAKIIEDSGAFAIVLEAIPMELAREITDQCSIPTIGCGAGPDCDGQIVVTHDILGLSGPTKPKFVKIYDDFGSKLFECIQKYKSEVEGRVYPDESFSYKMEPIKIQKVNLEILSR